MLKYAKVTATALAVAIAQDQVVTEDAGAGAADDSGVVADDGAADACADGDDYEFQLYNFFSSKIHSFFQLLFWFLFCWKFV